MDQRQYLMTVVSQGRIATTLSQTTVLESLLAAGIDYPHGCETGLCSLCKSRLVSGTIEQGDHFASALSDVEEAAGLFLPCTSHATADCAFTPVRNDAFLPPVRRVETVVRRVERLTHDTSLVVLAQPAGEPFEYLAGQYARVTFGDHDARDFSMANRPGEDEIAFVIRQVPGGRVTEKVVPALASGARVALRGPMGDAYLRESHLEPILLIAGGSGLAPIRAILLTALERGLRQAIHVYVGVRARRDLCFVDELARIADAHPHVTVHLALSDERSDDPAHRSGYVHDLLRTDLAGRDVADWEAYVAGPPPMVDAVAAVLDACGLPKERCHVDPFVVAAELEAMR